MLDATSQKPTASKVERLAMPVERLNLNLSGTGNFTIDFRKAQTSFRAQFHVPKRGDDRVDEHHGHVLVDRDLLVLDEKGGRTVGDSPEIHHSQLEGMIDLLGGQADTLGIFHGFEHVLDELLDLLGDLSDGPTLLPKDRVPIINYG